MHRTTTIATLSTALLLGVSGLAACGSSEDSSSAAQTPSATPSPSAADSPSAAASPSKTKASTGPKQAKTAMLTIKDYAYSGATSVAPGTKITVKNNDSEAHTVTTDSGGAFDVAIPPGASKTFTAPSKAGTYKYHCTYHANMHGTLTVG